MNPQFGDIAAYSEFVYALSERHPFVMMGAS
jgi:hypothetical protein